MKKDLNYYIRLPYKIEISQIPENEGGGYTAKLPQFGTLGIVGDGETIEEALASLENSKKMRLESFIEKGIIIPEPEPESSLTDYSGRILTRMPKWLHEKLALEAKENNSSLNQLIVTLLASGFSREAEDSSLEKILNEIDSLKENISDLKFNLETKYNFQSSLSHNYCADGYEGCQAA